MAIIGETLVAPEDGFTRYEFINKDDLTLNNEYFYSITASIIRDNNGLLAVGVSNGDEILVKIKNTSNFRLLVCLPDSTNANTLYTNNMVVEIDGVKHAYDLTSNQNATIIDNCLVVDIKNLSANNHIIKIYADGNNNDTQMINVQAIDIDEGGVIGFTRAMASMFEGCTSLKKDIIIPKNADIVENMFKNCTSMTHVHSNWDETYNDSGIIAEDCYSGCTFITHIDGVALNLNEYTNGLDDVPPEWGGYGYSREYTGIYTLEILTPNYTFSFASDGLLDNKYINWGDGTITQNEYSHTYVNTGIYIIKGQVHSTAQTVTDSMKLCLKEIIQYPIYGNLYYAFTGCTTLVDANISGNKYYDSNQSRSNVFQDCINLETVIALDTKLEKTTSHISAFQGCKKLRGVIGIGDFIYNTQNIANLFNDCPLLLNLTIPEDSLKNCKDATSAFNKCTSLTESPIKTFNVPNISGIFDGCTNITDISGVTFGEKITSADGWFPPKLTTANNVTIKNSVVDFINNSTLQYCNNLRCYSAKGFTGCTALVELKNLLIRSENGTVIDSSGSSAYRNCSKLKIITFNPNCKIKYNNCEYMFHRNPLLEEVDFGGGVTLEPKGKGNAAFDYTTALKTIKNMKVGGASTTARFSGYSTSQYGSNFTNLEYLDCTIMTQEASKFFKGSGIKDVSNIKFDTSIEDLSESFMNNRLLLQDVEVQSHIKNCSSMFRNCTALTHIRSNWNNSYVGEITSTDCYSGCTSITHIDDVALNLNEYTNGLDNIPSEWGGYGFSREYTGIYMIEIPSSNYTFSFASDGLLDNKHINWGDGTTTKNEYSHTYVNAGVYIIKGQVHTPVRKATNSMKSYLKEIIQYPIYGNLYYAFTGCTALISANISGNKYSDSSRSRTCAFQNCINLETVIALDTKLEAMLKHILVFQGCKKLREVIGIEDFIYNTQSIDSLFSDCSSLLDLTIPEDSLKNCKDATSAFNKCTSLTESPIKLFNMQNISRIFEGCNKIKDMSDVTFDEGITEADGWRPPNLTTLNNVTIKNKNNVINFINCGTLTECNNLTLTDNVTDISGLFSGCSNLTSLDLSGFNTSSVTNMSNMFYGCSSLTNIDLSSFDTSEVTDMSNMFEGCKNLTSVDMSMLDLSKVTNMNFMLHGCSNLKYWSGVPTTDNRISMDAILMETSIETIGLSDFSKVHNTWAFTGDCTTLKNIEIVPLSIELDDAYANWGIAEIWKHGTVLTDASLTQILNGLADKTGKDTVTIDFSSGGYLVRLTAEQIAIATNKNYTLV